jgi:hypothetical protein
MPDASAHVTAQRMRAIADQLQAAGLTARVHDTRGVLDITGTAHRSGGREIEVIVDQDGYAEIRYWNPATATPAENRRDYLRRPLRRRPARPVNSSDTGHAAVPGPFSGSRRGAGRPVPRVSRSKRSVRHVPSRLPGSPVLRSALRRRLVTLPGQRAFHRERGENGFMQGLANSYAFWIFAVIALAVVYMLPTLIGAIRRVDRLALVFLVNLIGAPTGVGWFAAIILAFGPRRLPPRSPLPVPPAPMPPETWMYGWQEPR